MGASGGSSWGSPGRWVAPLSGVPGSGAARALEGTRTTFGPAACWVFKAQRPCREDGGAVTTALAPAVTGVGPVLLADRAGRARAVREPRGARRRSAGHRRRAPADRAPRGWPRRSDRRQRVTRTRP